ncbi:MAG: DUF7452 domain-containing protein [Marinicella sp.]
MKYLILLISLFSATLLHAAVDWPGVAAPCNTTLQACVDGSPANEIIYLNTNDVIDETITAFKNISLIAGNGYKPVFAAGRHIDITNAASTNRTLIIEGLTLLRGRIAYNHLPGSSADTTLNIRKNNIIENSSDLTSIRVLNFSNQTLTVNIDYNQLNYSRTTSSSEERGAIAFQTGYDTGALATGLTTGRVYGNTISTSGPDSIGIGIFSYTETDVALNISGNEIHGGITGGVFSYRNDSTGTTDLNIAHNAFYQFSEDENFKGVFIQAFAGTTDADIVNNTALGAFDAFRFDEAGTGTLDVYFYNNIMAFGSAGVYTDAETTITNDYNLSYMNSFPDADFVEGPNHIYTNPLVGGMNNGRLRAGSPAIEAGSTLSLLALGGTPLIDADGTHRIKKGNSSVGAQQVDMGAYETGDQYFNHVTESGSHISVIDNDAINGDSSFNDIHITSNWNPPGSEGVYNDENEGIYYSGGFWRVFNEGITSFENGAAFNLHQYANTTNSFEHTSTEVGSSNTLIDDSTLNNQIDRIVQVTQHWTGIYNPHPIGVFYFAGTWVIGNFDGAEIPTNSNFNVYSQQPSKSAWLHVASSGNSFFNSSVIDHPLLNNTPCAEIQITQSADRGVFNDSPVGVYYSSGSWIIYNQDLSTILENSAFYVNINPAQIAACSDLIFEDGFE